jgi:hypothetical protein
MSERILENGERCLGLCIDDYGNTPYLHKGNTYNLEGRDNSSSVKVLNLDVPLRPGQYWGHSSRKLFKLLDREGK